jgi:hypothetical protein
MLKKISLPLHQNFKIKFMNIKTFETVVYLVEEQEEFLENLGIYTPPNEDENKIVKYTFDVHTIVCVSENLIKYEGEWFPAVQVTHGNPHIISPILKISHEDFLKEIGWK